MRIHAIPAISMTVLAFGVLALETPARAADNGVKVGVLTCDVDRGWGFVFGSTRDLKCTFSHGRSAEHYTGHISD